MRKSKRSIEKIVRNIMDQELKSLLHDIDYRIGILADLAARAGGQPPSRYNAVDLALPYHVLDGFTFTNNSPGAGSIAWTGCHIVYKGTDNEITDGNTNQKYVCWLASAPTIFTCGDVKPDLTVDDVLVAINDNGAARVLLTPGKMIHGSVMISGSVDETEIKNGAISTAKIADKAVGSAKLGDGAVTNAKLGDGAVTTGKVGDGQITGPKIGAGAVGEAKLNIASHLIY
jgi:hypothetical protein